MSGSAGRAVTQRCDHEPSAAWRVADRGAPSRRDSPITGARIVHCIPSAFAGGAERQLAQLVAAQRRHGLEPHVVLRVGGPYLEAMQAAACGVHLLPARASYDPRTSLDIRRILREVDASVVQTWLPQMDVMGGLAAVSERRPWVLSERCNADAYVERFREARLRPWIARWASAIVSNSRVGDEYWRDRVPTRVLRRVIPNAVPLAEIARAEPRMPPDFLRWDHAPLVLFAGRFAAQKNVSTLLRALAIVFARSPAVALCCGDGPLGDELAALARSLAIESRLVLSPYRADLWSLMKRAAVFVNPSFFEGQPNTVIEAMACACPLVVSDIPAHRAFLDETTAQLVEPSSVEGFAEAILATLTAPPTARVARARELAGSMSSDAMAARYERVYEALLTSRR